MIPFLVGFIGVPLLSVSGLFSGVPFSVPIGLVFVASAIGGAVAGGFSMGRRASLAFSVAFVFTLWMPLLIVTSLQSLSGREPFFEIFVGVGGGFGLAYFLLGSVGVGVLSNMRLWKTLWGGLVFAVGGLTGGLFLAASVTVASELSDTIAVSVRLGGGALSCLIPSSIGGWWVQNFVCRTR
jgi:hypothetical protein